MRSRFLTLSVALVVALLAGGADGCSSDPNVEGAKLDLRNGDFDAAISNLDEALQTNPDNVEALTLRAEVRRQQADRAPLNQKAEILGLMVTDVNRASTLAPDDADVAAAQINAWALAVNAGNDALRNPNADVNDAVALFQTAVDVQPDSMQGSFGLGLSYLRGGDASAAVAPLARAVELAPDDATSAVYYSRSLLLSDQGAEAVSVLEAAADRFPDDTDIQTSLLNAYAVSGQTDRAIERYEQAIVSLPQDETVRYNYGALLLEAGRYDEAIEQLTIATELAPDNSDAFYNLGASYQNKAASLNDEANAMEDADAANQMIAERDENLEAALPFLQQARTLSAGTDDEAGVCNALFRVYTQLGRVDDAEGVAECAGMAMN
ncbi:MAG: tetratricopeptide repeat protein [Bacteroidota bacterium]